MKTIIKNGVLLDSTGALTQADVEMEGKYITKVAENIAAEGLQQIDAKGNLIAPGFIDLHVHLREPGGEKKKQLQPVQWQLQREGLQR